MTRVLIVEDSATQAEELALLLESRGFEVAVARDGNSGLERCRTEHFDVVLSDIVMPGIDGYELCRRVKQEPKTRELPVLLLTSLTDPLDIIHGLECGADNFITKPYDGDFLVSRLRQLLENRGLRASRKLDVGVELVMMGKRFTINSEKEQMVDLLISTFEEVLRSRQREYEAKVAEESHRQSHQLLQSALDALSAQIAIVDLSGEIVAVNVAWRRMSDVCGWAWPSAGVGEDYQVVLKTAWGSDPEHVRLSLSGVEDVRAGRKQFFQLEYPGLIRDRERWFNLCATRFEGNGLALLAIENEDITEQRKAAEEVQRSAAALRDQTRILNSILKSMSEGVLVTSGTGELLLANPRAEEMLGIDTPAATGSAWSGALGYQPDEKTPIAAEDHPLWRAVHGQVTRDLDLFCKSPSRPGGMMLAVSGAPLRDEDGSVTGGVLVMRDVTQQRKLEQQLQQAQKMDAIGQLAGGVAHDFNNLLSVITSYGELLISEVPEGDSRHEDLSELLQAARRAASLTRQLLAFSRRQMIQPSVLELNVVVGNVDKMLRRVIGEDIDLLTVLDPNIGRVMADPGQIEQVLLNLSVNARDAMPKGGKLTIETSSVLLDGAYVSAHAGVAPGYFAVLAVSDNGTGMDAETQARIFEPFFTTKEVGKGTGLGLSTVYGIVQQSGGHIWVYSEVGRGTTFKVYLPIVDEPATADATPRRQGVAPEVSEKILLVEDDDAVRQVAVRILRQRGYHVFEAKGADEARAICREPGNRIDLLLTDVIMPDMNGPDLALELSRYRPGLRVLYMSGYSGTAVFRHGALANGMAFLEKPFAPESLTEKVREVLDAPL